jgi:hypothetical protein
MDVIINICLLYSIKCVYIIPSKYSKVMYIYIYSPLIICNGLYRTNIVSYKYWNFLIKLSFPNCINYSKYNNNCKDLHKTKCYNLSEFNQMFKKICSLYFKYYSINYIFLKFTKPKNGQLYLNIINFIQSTLFLFLQNFLQRFGLCSTSNLTPFYMYSLTSLCSIPIIFENINRVSQINIMMLSNIIIGIFDKFLKKQKNIVSFILLFLTIFKHKRIHYNILKYAIINGLIQSNITKSIKKIGSNLIDSNKDNIILPPWHPFL